MMRRLKRKSERELTPQEYNQIKKQITEEYINYYNPNHIKCVEDIILDLIEKNQNDISVRSLFEEIKNSSINELGYFSKKYKEYVGEKAEKNDNYEKVSDIEKNFSNIVLKNNSYGFSYGFSPFTKDIENLIHYNESSEGEKIDTVSILMKVIVNSRIRDLDVFLYKYKEFLSIEVLKTVLLYQNLSDDCVKKNPDIFYQDNDILINLIRECVDRGEFSGNLTIIVKNFSENKKQSVFDGYRKSGDDLEDSSSPYVELIYVMIHTNILSEDLIEKNLDILKTDYLWKYIIRFTALSEKFIKKHQIPLQDVLESNEIKLSSNFILENKKFFLGRKTNLFESIEKYKLPKNIIMNLFKKFNPQILTDDMIKFLGSLFKGTNEIPEEIMKYTIDSYMYSMGDTRDEFKEMLVNNRNNVSENIIKKYVLDYDFSDAGTYAMLAEGNKNSLIDTMLENNNVSEEDIREIIKKYKDQKDVLLDIIRYGVKIPADMFGYFKEFIVDGTIIHENISRDFYIYQDIPEEFMIELKDDLDWSKICNYQNLSLNFILGDVFYYIDADELIYNRNIDQEKLKRKKIYELLKNRWAK